MPESSSHHHHHHNTNSTSTSSTIQSSTANTTFRSRRTAFTDPAKLEAGLKPKIEDLDHGDDDEDEEDKNKDKDKRRHPWYTLPWRFYVKNVPRLIRLIIDWLVGSMIIGFLPIYYLSVSPSLWITLHQPTNKLVVDNKTWARLECCRWGIYFLALWTGLIVSYHTSFLVAKFISLMVRRSRDFIAKDTRRILDFLTSSWRYLCLSLTCALIWYGICIKIFIYHYPPPPPGVDDVLLRLSDQPWQYYFERGHLLMIFMWAYKAITRAIVHGISVSINQNVYQERVHRCMFGVWLVKTLRDATFPATSLPNWLRSSWRRRKIQTRTKDTPPALFPYSPSEAMNTFLLENIHSARTVSQEALREVFSVLKKEDSDFIVEDDLAPYIHRSQLTKAFLTFDSVNNGDVTEWEFIQAAQNLYTERFNLVQCLTNQSNLMKKLNSFSDIIVGLFTLFTAFILLVGVESLQSKNPSGVGFSLLLFALLSKNVGDIFKNFMSSLIYVFYIHSFDVGDRVTVDGAHFLVREVNLLSTALDRIDGMRVYYSNYTLAGKSVGNVRRVMNGQRMRFELIFDADTSSNKLLTLRQRLLDFVRTEQRDYVHVQTISVDLVDCDYLRFVVLLNHRQCQQDGTGWRIRNSRFLEHAMQVCNELNLQKLPIMRSIQIVDL